MKLKKKGIISTIAGVVLLAAILVVCLVIAPSTQAKERDVSGAEAVSENDETAKEVVTEDVSGETVSEQNVETPAEAEDIVDGTADSALTEKASSDNAETAEVITWTSPFSATTAYHITSRFGNRSPGSVSGAMLYHGAVDFAAPKGTELLAACDGTVETAGWDGERGYAVTIKVNEDISYRYAHLDEIKVEEGDIVKAGDLVATVGSSGVSTGPHLHLELILHGKYVDPLKYIQIPEDTRETPDE